MEVEKICDVSDKDVVELLPSDASRASLGFGQAS